MKKLRYSPDVVEKLHLIKKEVTSMYGLNIADSIIKKMIYSFRELKEFENKGPSVESVIGIPCDYRFFYIQHNYIFYRIDDDTIWIVDIYNEREDFMWKLFGIKTTTKETENYWDEQ